MLYQIDDLRTAVETAKRLLTKEQIDKKSGQATTNQFMKTSQENSKSKSKNEKKVYFSAVEAMERTTDSIERLASLTLSMLHATIVMISSLVKKCPRGNC